MISHHVAEKRGVSRGSTPPSRIIHAHAHLPGLASTRLYILVSHSKLPWTRDLAWEGGSAGVEVLAG